MNETAALAAMIRKHERIVFFGGAGVSTESNIPDFRSSDGIYKKKRYPYPAEHMISHDFYVEHPSEFYDFYMHEMIYPDARANDAHKALAALEDMGKLQAVVTQNIDGLHQQAGSKTVYELHGSVHRNYCTKCHAFYGLEAMLQQRNTVPCCSVCGGILKPDVVLYGEGLDQHVLSSAIRVISEADMMIVGGTSLVVYPAAGLLQYFRGQTLVLINKDETSMDEKADLIIRRPIGSVLKEAVAQL